MIPRIHLIANAHLDPVWLWDWREGLNEGISTCRTVVRLMEEFPELTFVRGEAAIYEHIEREDPGLFAQIRNLVHEGRWDVVGGTYVQSDMNLPSATTLLRQFEVGNAYFESRFGRRARVGWSPDAFGHSAGLPEILSASGIDSYIYCRPGAGVGQPVGPAFWWESASAARVLCYRPFQSLYLTERVEHIRFLEEVVAGAKNSPIRNHVFLYGLGNHGGGPTRRHLLELREWAAAHPEVEVVHSSLHRFFDELRAELTAEGGPAVAAHRGELNFVFRGCYASAARIKFSFRRAEARAARAECVDAVVSSALGRQPSVGEDLWAPILFNSFHDILPGTSIERACEDQIEQLGGALRNAQESEFRALNALGRAVDTKVGLPAGASPDHPHAVPFLLWNPHPRSFRGHVELEACLDARPIFSYLRRGGAIPLEVRGPSGEVLPFQRISEENLSLRELDVPWRVRVLVPVEIPPLGWSVVTLAWREGARRRYRDPILPAATARNGGQTIRIGGNLRLSAFMAEDHAGSWGRMSSRPEDVGARRAVFRVTGTKLLESGPECSALWVRMEASRSRIEFTFLRTRRREPVDVQVRVLWAERSARLKLEFSGPPGIGREAEFAVPGGTIRRKPGGEVPGGLWVRSGRFGFASDALYNFEFTGRAFRATVCRASRYAADNTCGPEDMPWQPAVDAGELKFRFLVTGQPAKLPHHAEELVMPPVVQIVPSGPGVLPRSGSLLTLEPLDLQLLAVRSGPAGGLNLTIRNPGSKSVRAVIGWPGRRRSSCALRPGEIRKVTLDAPPLRAAARASTAASFRAQSAGLRSEAREQ